MNTKSQPFPAHNHDHDVCVADLIQAAEATCLEKSLRLTPLRRRVLEIVAQNHKAIGAYEVMDLLSDGEKRPAPITVYRVLDFLTEHGFVHRLSSLNAFVTCQHPDGAHEPNFLICEQCGSIGEITTNEIEKTLKLETRRAGFVPQRAVIEVLGLCPRCQ